MNTYTVRFSKENWGKIYQTIVKADDEHQAFILARDECESKGIKLPKEIWTRITKHK